MREIFANNSVARLVQTVDDVTLELQVDSTASFPVPIVGEEYFHATIVGVCNTTTEIVRVVEVCDGNCLKLSDRGVEGTTAQSFAPGDMVYHGLTAETLQILFDQWKWYLGAFDTPPVLDNQGFPLEEGHLYYDTVIDRIQVWNGTQWTNFSPTIGAFIIEEFTWIPVGAPYLADTVIPFPDIYGAVPGDWVAGEHAIVLYLNGSKLVEEVDDLVLAGDYTIDYGNDEITTLNQIEIGDVLQAQVLLRSDSNINPDYIQRTEVDVSGFGFTDNDGTLAADSDLLYATQKAIKTYADGKVKWQGSWTAQVYQPNDMVKDGQFVAIANTTTTSGDRPAPQVTPATPPTYGHPSPSWSTVANGSVVTVTNDFTLNTAGWIQTIKLAAMDVGSITQYTLEILDVTNPGSPITLYQPFTSLNVIASEVEYNIGDIYVENTKVISIRLTYTGTAVVRDEESAYWTGTIPAWSSDVVGTIDIDGGGFASSDDAYGIDILFQEGDDLNAKWDHFPVPVSGGAGGGGAIGGSSIVHHVEDVAPLNSQGNDGDVWFVRL
jgi:hypothetical protein